jgi:hypothetical protein
LLTNSRYAVAISVRTVRNDRHQEQGRDTSALRTPLAERGIPATIEKEYSFSRFSTQAWLRQHGTDACLKREFKSGDWSLLRQKEANAIGLVVNDHSLRQLVTAADTKVPVHCETQCIER